MYPSRSSHQLKKKIMPLDEKAVMLKLKVFPKNANVHAARRAARPSHVAHRLHTIRARRATWWPELRAVKAGPVLKASSTTVLRLYPRSKSVSHYVLQRWQALQIAGWLHRFLLQRGFGIIMMTVLMHNERIFRQFCSKRRKLGTNGDFSLPDGCNTFSYSQRGFGIIMIRDGTRNPSFLVDPDLFSLLDFPRNRFYHSSDPRVLAKIPGGPRKYHKYQKVQHFLEKFHKKNLIERKSP